MRYKKTFRMMENDQQNEVIRQIKQLEVNVDNDSGYDRSNGSSNQSNNSKNEAEDSKK